jgi:prepilin-type N-terminal cleavage/methylation domain-containing protein
MVSAYKKGFTLIELLLVIAIMGMLSSVVLMYVRPTAVIAKAKDAERLHYANQLERAISQRIIDSDSINIQTIPTEEANAKPICVFEVTDPDCSTAGGLDLSVLIPDYLPTLARDQSEPNVNFTGYTIYNRDGFVQVVPAHLGESAVAIAAAESSSVSSASSSAAPVAVDVQNGVSFNTLTSQLVAPWPTIENGAVLSSVPDGSGGWYIGGWFDTIDGVSRNYAAHILADGTLDPVWNPNPGYPVVSMVKIGSTIYAAGQFTTIGGATRRYIAGLDATTGNATAFNANIPCCIVNAIATDGVALYITGNFASAGGQPRNYIAALDPATGNATAWNPNANGRGMSIALDGGAVYVGGRFTTVGGSPHTAFVALDKSTGDVVWDAALVINLATNEVDSIVIDDRVYIAGGFTEVLGSPRSYLAAIEFNGDLSTWNPQPNDIVMDIAKVGSTIYAVGGFTTIGGESRNNFAALNDTTGNATNLDLNPDDFMEHIGVDGTKLYLGGWFYEMWQ